jgi:hypothetical protein
LHPRVAGMRAGPRGKLGEGEGFAGLRRASGDPELEVTESDETAREDDEENRLRSSQHFAP